MKKFFKYIENFWTGHDGKPSIRRLLAISFSIDLLITFHKLSDVTYKLIQMIYSSKQLDAQVISSISSFLANEAMIIGIEAGFIAGLLSLTTYQNLQLNKPYDSTPPYQNVDQSTSIPKVPVESTDN